MQFPRPGRLLLWAVLFVFLAPMVVGIPASLWLSWRLDPVQSFYFGPYLASAIEGGTKGALSTVRYAEKTAPGSKPEMLLPVEAVAGKAGQRIALKSQNPRRRMAKCDDLAIPEGASGEVGCIPPGDDFRRR